jgi:NTP pyrophosphatase (non-canonical NTP hydrolase)
MLSTKALQARIYQNKVAQGFNVSNIEKEVCLLHGELAEFYEAYRKRLPTVGEELADVAIYLLGLAEILQVDIGKEIDRKMNINEHRKYAQIDGVNTRISE